MTHKKRLLSALAVVAAGALMLTFAGPYRSGASDPVGVAALWGDYSDDNQYASKGTFNYDAPGDSEDVTLAASDITKLRDQIGKLALTAQAADAGLDSGMAGAVSEASTANTGALASLKASVDTLNATLASKEFGRDTTVMVYRTSVGNVDLAQATVYEAMTMGSVGLPTFSNPASSLYAVYALGDNPGVDLTTATPLGLFRSCSGGGTSDFTLQYFPRGAYDSDTPSTITLPRNLSTGTYNFNYGRPYFFALARIAAPDRETKFGMVQVAKAQKCNMTDLPAKCGSATSIDDAKYVFWFGDDISGEPAGIWKGTVATNDTISTASIASSEKGVTTGYGCDIYVRYTRAQSTLSNYSGSTQSLGNPRNSISATLRQMMTYKDFDNYYVKGSGTSVTWYQYQYLGRGSEIFKELTNITPVNATEQLVGTDYVYWTDKDAGTTAYRRNANATAMCTCKENYYNMYSDYENVSSSITQKTTRGDSANYTGYSLSSSYTAELGSYSYEYSPSGAKNFRDTSNVSITRNITANTASGTTVTFAPLVK